MGTLFPNYPVAGIRVRVPFQPYRSAEIVTELSNADSSRWPSLETSLAWRRSCILLGVCLSVLVLLYWPTIVAIVSQWRSRAFAHGFLIVPISAYLVWTRRKSLALLKPVPNFWPLLFVVLFALGWLFAQLTATGVVQQFCFVAMTIMAIWGVLGTVVTRALVMPLAFLMFAVPAGESVIPKLQDFAAWFAVKMLDFSRVPVLVEGRFISVPSGRWEVAEACSGMRYLTSSITIGFLYAGLAYRTWIRRIGFLFASAVVPVLANGFRVYGIILLAYLSGNRIAAGVDHLIYGWIFFTIVMILLFCVGFWWREKPEAENTLLPRSAQDPEDSARARSEGEGLRTSAKRTVLFFVLFILVVGLGPFSAKVIWSPAGELLPLHLVAPEASLPWRISSRDASAWNPSFSAPNAELTQSYESNEHIVKLHLACYGPAQQDAKLVSSTNILFDKKYWLRTGEDETAVTVGGQSFYVHEEFIRSAQQSLVVWNWYWVDGRFTSNEYLTKYLLARTRFLRSHQPTAAIALATEDPQGPQEAAEVLEGFLNHVALQRTL